MSSDHLPYIIYHLQPGQQYGVRLIEAHTGDGHKTDIVGQDITPDQAGKLTPLLACALLVRPFEIDGLTAKPDDERGLRWTIYDREGGELRQYSTPGAAIRAMLTDRLRAQWEAPDLSIDFPCIYD